MMVNLIVMVNLILLAYRTSRDEGIDEGGKSRPPKVSFQESLGAELSCMSSSGRVMYGADNGLSLMWGNVHVTFEVQVAIGHMPIVLRGAGEQGGSQFQTLQCSEY